jgi:phage FluMu protein Com
MDSLTIGERDALLAQIRGRTFGRDLASVATCPVCREVVEVSVDVRAIFPDKTQAAPSEETSRQPLVIAAGDFVVHVAVPAVRDVEAIVTTATPAEGLRMLWRRCILRAEHRGEPYEVDDLPEHVCALIDKRLAEADPQGAVYLSLHCPGCDHRWRLLFDMAAYFWIEIQMGARRLLREIHLLASAYGWGESEILSLSAARRRAYLEMAAG